jgi:hypothetical protein
MHQSEKNDLRTHVSKHVETQRNTAPMPKREHFTVHLHTHVHNVAGEDRVKIEERTFVLHTL